MNNHQEPKEGSTCLCCWDDLTEDTYVEYQTSEASPWLPAGYCSSCIEELLSTQFHQYVKAITTTTCKAEMRRLLNKGPPINLQDAKALPCPDDKEVYSLWFSKDKLVHSAKLDGSLVGDEREKFWKEKMNFFAENEPEEIEADSMK